ncbi:MAG: Gfo/Idh/MocA family oxidoreductase [Pirellulales bacterium]|nr:Gfo/Idh/MocA family oxidoreductase [Pirellulales bacterium]
MSEKTAVLVIGVGSIGERHVRCFQATGRAHVSLCEINAELRYRIAEKYGVQQAYSDLDAALAGRHNAAVICAPAHLHISMAMKLAEAGVHLLIEKPLSTSLDGTDDLRRTVARRGLVTAVAYVQRAQPTLEAMKRALDSGRFGRPVHLVVTCGQHFPTYRPAYREIYYKDRATGGGAIQDALTHMVNAAEWLVGPVDRVAGDAAHQVLQGVEVEDTVNVIARHGAVMAAYSLNQHQAPNETAITVVCDKGACRWELHRNRWRWMTEPGGAWHDEPFDPIERDTVFVRQAGAFLDTLEGKRPPLCSLDEGIQTLRVNLAILAAVQKQAWQSVR